VRVTAAFKRLLALPGVNVINVEFLARLVVVTVPLKRRRLVCPLCDYSTAASYDRRPVDSRCQHLDLGVWQLEVRARLRRLWCPTHGVRTEGVLFARPASRFTHDFEMLVAWLATRTDATSITKLVRISWRTVGRIIERVVADELDPGRLDDLFEIGVDEISWRKHHNYVTLVADHRTGKVVWCGEGKSAKTLDGFFHELGPDRCRRDSATTTVFLASCVLQRSGDGYGPGIMPGTVHRPLEPAHHSSNVDGRTLTPPPLQAAGCGVPDTTPNCVGTTRLSTLVRDPVPHPDGPRPIPSIGSAQERGPSDYLFHEPEAQPKIVTARTPPETTLRGHQLNTSGTTIDTSSPVASCQYLREGIRCLTRFSPLGWVDECPVDARFDGCWGFGEAIVASFWTRLSICRERCPGCVAASCRSRSPVTDSETPGNVSSRR